MMKTKRTILFLTGKFAAISILCVLVLALSGCNAKESKNAVTNDIVAMDSYYSQYNLKVKKSEITKRQTNTDEKTDYIWLTVYSENENFEYRSSYKITYVLYNDGWELDNYSVISSDYSSKTEPNLKELEDELHQKYRDIELTYEIGSTSTNSKSYEYAVKSETNYVISTYSITVDFTFTPAKGWQINKETEFLKNKQYNIIGEWLFKDEAHIYYIHVSNVDNEKITLKYSLYNKYSTNSDGYWKLRSSDYNEYIINTFSDNEVYFDVGWKHKYKTISFADESVLWFCNNNVTVHGEENNGLVVNGFFLKKISDNTSDTEFPEDLKKLENEVVVDYSTISNNLFDTKLIEYLGYFDKTYSELGLNPNKSSNTTKTRYPLEKAGFANKQVFVTLWFPDNPAESSMPSSIELNAIGKTFEETRAYFIETLQMNVYEDSNDRFYVLVPNTDIKIEVFQDILTVNAYITRP